MSSLFPTENTFTEESAESTSTTTSDVNSESEESENFSETFDLRKYQTEDGETANVVGSVKLQNPWGACWAFGAISACETSLMSSNGLDRNKGDDVDLSELHLAYFAYDYIKDNADNQQNEGTHFLDNETTLSRLNMGGEGTTATSVLSAGVGPVFEEDAPYKNSTGAIAKDSDAMIFPGQPNHFQAGLSNNHLNMNHAQSL